MTDSKKTIKIERQAVLPEDRQFFQAQQFNVAEIARRYNLPSHLLRETSRSEFFTERSNDT